MSNELSNFDIIDIIKDLKLDHCFGGVYRVVDRDLYGSGSEFHVDKSGS